MFVKNVSHRFNDGMMGYAAGVMLAATFMGLIQPAMEIGSAHAGIMGLLAGGLLISVLDKAVPHLHNLAGANAEAVRESHLDKVILFVIAIAITICRKGWRSASASRNRIPETP
jgi:ZIP family zinc transporter